jgi:hypothetical protein
MDLGVVEIVVLLLFVAWCVAVFLFLRFLYTRAKKSAAEPEPGRKELDALIDKIEKEHAGRYSEP